MTIEEFRLLHSELIEHYQFIEHHLEGIYSSLQGEKSFYEGLLEVENDNIPRLLKRIKAIQDGRGVIVISEEDSNLIEQMCSRRNFWCHNCYVDMVFDRKTGGPRKETDIKKMRSDLQEAQKLRDYLFDKKIHYMDEMKNKV